jgi:hypothetical protein
VSEPLPVQNARELREASSTTARAARLPRILLERLRSGWPFAAVLAAAAVAHLPTLFNGFVWDDLTFVIGNPVLRDAGNALALFSKPETWGTEYVNPYYRPLTMLSFLADFLLWGERAIGFHATNVLLHLSVCGLLLAALRRLLPPGAALAAALLFAVHPAHAEPVAYISARADLICALFLLVAFLAWSRYGESGGRGALTLSALAYTAAIFAKATAGLFPAVFALHGLLFFRRRPRVRDLLPFAAGALLFLAARGAVLEMHAWPGPPLLTRAATAGPLVVRYVLMALSPASLRVFHDLQPRTVFDAMVVEAWLVIAVAIAVAAMRARIAPRVALGLAWFLAGIFPVSGIVTVLFPAIAADRYLYIPLLGAALAAGALVQRLGAVRLSAPRGRLAAVGAAVLLATLAGFTMARGRHWRDDVTLWTRAVRRAPRNLYALNGLALAYGMADRDAEARQTLRSVLEINEADFQAHLNLAYVALRMQDLSVAERHTLRALELDPGSAAAYRVLSLVHLEKGNLQAARQAAQTALSLNPYDTLARELLEVQLRDKQSTAAN